MKVRRVRQGQKPPTLLGRAVDYVLDACAPKRALANRYWRENGEKLAAMAAGSISRAMDDWDPPEGDANALTIEDLPKVRSRTRDAALNDPIAQAVRRTLADHVVGSGFTPECLIDYEKLGISDQQAQDWQGACKDYFQCASKRADVTGRLNWVGLQRLVFLSMWDGGDVFPSFPMTVDEDGNLATRVNLIEAERVDTPQGELSNPLVNGGVQVDKWARVEGFHVYRGHPFDAHAQRRTLLFEFWPVRRKYNGGVRVNVLQVANQERIGQARGIPGFAQCLPLLDHTSNYLDEVLLSARIQNAMSIWISTGGDAGKAASALSGVSGNNGSSNPYTAYQERGVSPGSINTINSGDEIKYLGPTTPGQYTDPLIVRLLRQIAACIGVPYEVLFGDVGAANYSSMRAGFQILWKTIAQWQQPLIPFFDAYWMHCIREAWLDGKLGKVGMTIPFEDAPDEWARVSWTLPKRGYIDPTKEMAAYKLAVDNGFMSRSQVIVEGGGNASDVFQQLANEQQELDELGVTLGAFMPQQGSGAQAPQDQQGPKDTQNPQDQPADTQDPAASTNDQPAEGAVKQ